MGGDRRGKKKEHKKRERQTNGDWWTVRQKINAQNRFKKKKKKIFDVKKSSILSLILN